MSEQPEIADDPRLDPPLELGDVPAVEVVLTVAMHLMSAAAVACGLGVDEDGQPAPRPDLAEARILITSLAGLVTAAAPLVGHAQEIVGELIGMLDVRAWDGADALLSVYGFVLRELFAAGADGDATRVASCRALLEPLRLAWHEAADETGRSAIPTPREPAEPVGSGLLGVA